MTLRILKVSHGFPPREHAGAELCCFFLSREFQRRGHEVRVLTRTDDPDLPAYVHRDEVVDGVQVVRLRTPAESAGSLEETYRDPRVRDFFEAQLQWRPDVVHFHHTFGLSADLIEAAKDRGVAVVMTLHDFWYLCPRGQRLTPRGHLCAEIQPWRCSLCIAKKRVRWALNAATRRGGERRGPGPWRYFRDNLAIQPITTRQDFLMDQLNRVDLCLAPSEFVLAEYRRHGLTRPITEFCPNGMAVEWLSRWSPRERPHDPLRFGFLGSFLPSKGVDLLVEAFEGIAPGRAQLHLHGTSPWDDGAFESQLRSRCRHPDVAFHGRFEHARLPEVLAELDVLVVPSRWFENAPLALDEAALAQIPVIGSDHGGMREWIQRRGHGLLFRPGDAQSLREALTQFLDRPSLWQELRHPAEPVRTVADQAAELEAWYATLLR